MTDSATRRAPQPATAPARTLNPAAGDHVVTADAVELAAAERAVHRSWAEFPYYARRYGARGRSFSSSDSGWLITLCGMRPQAAAAQALWLGAVLASRGMPRWLLEHHLAALHEELVRVRPELAPRYAVLLGCADALRARRLAHLDDESLAALERGFAERVDPADLHRLRRMGGILAAAVADERDGLDAAVSSIVSWAADPERFSPGWIEAVLETVAAARAATR